MAEDDVKSELDRLRAENERLKSQHTRGVTSASDVAGP